MRRIHLFQLVCFLAYNVGNIELTSSLGQRRKNRLGNRQSRLRDVRAAIKGLRTAARFVGRGLRLATNGPYEAAKRSLKYMVTISRAFVARTRRLRQVHPRLAPSTSRRCNRLQGHHVSARRW
jgi:hypothetical protein